MKPIILNHWTGKDIAESRDTVLRDGARVLDSRREFLGKLGVAGGVLLASGLWAPRRAEAGSVIKARTISSVVDNRIQLANSNFARPVNGITGWATLRVGIRYIANNNAGNITGTPRFSVGFCSGNSNLLLDATTTHFVGIRTTTATWTYHAASGGSMADYDTLVINGTKRVTSTTTDATGSAVLFVPSDSTATTRRMYFVDLIHGSPNYTFKSFYCSSITATPDVLQSDFLQWMGSSSPSFTNHTYNTVSGSLAVDEATNGTLDNVSVAWDQATPTIEICDIAVAKIA